MSIHCETPTLRLSDLNGLHPVPDLLKTQRILLTGDPTRRVVVVLLRQRQHTMIIYRQDLKVLQIKSNDQALRRPGIGITLNEDQQRRDATGADGVSDEFADQWGKLGTVA